MPGGGTRAPRRGTNDGAGGISPIIHGITGASMPMSTVNKNQYITIVDIISDRLKN